MQAHKSMYSSVKHLEVSMLLGFGGVTEMGEDHTSLGVHVLLGGLTLELRGHTPHILVKIIYLLTPETTSCSLTVGHTTTTKHHTKILN